VGAGAVQAPQYEPSFEIGTNGSRISSWSAVKAGEHSQPSDGPAGLPCDNLACGREGSRISVCFK